MRNKKGMISRLLAALAVLVIAGSLFVACNQPTDSDSSSEAATLELQDSTKAITLTFSDFKKSEKSCKFRTSVIKIGTMTDPAKVTAKATFNSDFSKLTFSNISPAKATGSTGLNDASEAYDTSTITSVSILSLTFDLTKVKEKLN